MRSAADQNGLLAILRSELRLREVAVPEALLIQQPPFDWTIHRDEFGFTVTFPLEHFSLVATFVSGIFGTAQFSSEHGPTIIHRDDDACVTVMVTTDRGAGQLILLYWKDSGIRSTMAERQSAAIQGCIESAIQEACGAAILAVDSVGSPREDVLWNEAVEKLDEASEALDAFRDS
jgi:hypothetical protein